MNEIFNHNSTSLWESIYYAYNHGIIDIPFAPHIDNSNKLITVRDKNKAIRILNPGGMPIKSNDLEVEKKLLSINKQDDLNLSQKLLRDINLMI